MKDEEEEEEGDEGLKMRNCCHHGEFMGAEVKDLASYLRHDDAWAWA